MPSSFGFAMMAFLISAPLLAQTGGDKMVGNWRYVSERATGGVLNIASETITVEKLDPTTLREVTKQTLKSGEKKTIDTKIVCDGQENPEPMGTKNSTAICDPATFNVTVKRDGKVVTEINPDFSSDSRTVTTIGGWLTVPVNGLKMFVFGRSSSYPSCSCLGDTSCLRRSAVT